MGAVELQHGGVFYPSSTYVPGRLRTEKFLLRPLLCTDVEKDYAAVMDSKNMLRDWSQSDWPTNDFALSDNLEDLRCHERDHLDRQAFTFTVLDLTETICLGCVYIEPLSLLLASARLCEPPLVAGNHEAVVRFWVRASRLGSDLEPSLLTHLLAWFKSGQWAFSRVVYLSRDSAGRQAGLFSEAGLSAICTLQMPDLPRKQVVYA